MKLFILKLLSLIVLSLGVLSLFFVLGISEVTGYVAELPAQIAEFQKTLPDSVSWALDLKILWLIGSIAAIVFGVYGFLPRTSKWKKPKKISYDGPHGQVMIQLDTVEQSLNRVLARMPEVKKIDVVVEPRDGGRSALIKAKAVLQHQPGQNARAIAGLVSDYIAETATKMLGLEELATIELNVTGINVNSRKSSKEIRKESLTHSGNAPVELLEASPKPLGLSAPGEPLGSGPLEEEIDEDGTVDANAVDSAEEESKKAAARSELLEPLSLHNIHEDAREDEEAETEASVEPTDDAIEDDEETPNIVYHSVEGSRANASVVPEPLGDLSDETEEAEEDEIAESVDEEVGEEVGEVEFDVEVPEFLPDAEESQEETEASAPVISPWASVANDDASDDAGTANSVDEDAVAVTPIEEEAATPSAWATEELGETEDETSVADDDEATPSNLSDSEATDSIMGDLDGEDDEVVMGEIPEFEEEQGESTGDAEVANEGEGEGEKKRWGWFN